MGHSHLAQDRNQWPTGRTREELWYDFRQRSEIFPLLLALPCPLWGPVTRFLFSVKRPGRGADRSASSAEVKNAWSYVSTVLYALLEFCLIKDRQLYRREQCTPLELHTCERGSKSSGSLSAPFLVLSIECFVLRQYSVLWRCL